MTSKGWLAVVNRAVRRSGWVLVGTATVSGRGRPVVDQLGGPSNWPQVWASSWPKTGTTTPRDSERSGHEERPGWLAFFVRARSRPLFLRYRAEGLWGSSMSVLVKSSGEGAWSKVLDPGVEARRCVWRRHKRGPDHVSRETCDRLNVGT